MAKKYEKLLSPIKVGNLTLDNRIVRAPAHTDYCDIDGFCTERLEALYESFAKGGAGLIFMEGCSPYEWRTDIFRICGLWSDEHIPGYKVLTDKVHQHQGIIIQQICSTGPANFFDPQGASTLTADEMPWPPSVGAPVRGVSREEMALHKQQHIDTAIRAQKAGFDGVELHCAHSYYMQTFLSRTWNKRTDEYGCQSIENRTRFAVEIIKGMREALGPDYVIGVRMNGQEYGADPNFILTSEEAVEIAQAFEAAGVDYISVAGEGFNLRGDVSAVASQHQPDYWTYPEPNDSMKQYMARFKEGLFIQSAEAIHQAVKVPVIGVGRQDEDSAEELLQQGKVDLVAFARSLFADPEMPNKLKEGRYDDIVHCTRCGTCEDPLNSTRRCRVNPSLGLYGMDIMPAESKKKVLVIGGGPAGMEAARVAALRGHDVTLYEKGSSLGGHLPLAAMIKGTELDNVLPVIEYLTNQLKKLPVKVKTGKEVTKEVVRELKPDAVVIATGGKYVVPNLPGLNNRNVTDVNALSKLAETPLKLLGPKALNTLSNIALPGIGKRVIIIGGQIAGLQGAVFMKKRGKEVTVLESADTLGKGIVDIYYRRMMAWFPKANIPIYSGISFDEITKKGVAFTTKDGEKKFVEGDTVVILPSQSPNENLKKELEGLVPEIFMAGSVYGAERELIEHAIADGRNVGLAV